MVFVFRLHTLILILQDQSPVQTRSNLGGEPASKRTRQNIPHGGREISSTLDQAQGDMLIQMLSQFYTFIPIFSFLFLMFQYDKYILNDICTPDVLFVNKFSSFGLATTTHAALISKLF